MISVSHRHVEVHIMLVLLLWNLELVHSRLQCAVSFCLTLTDQWQITEMAALCWSCWQAVSNTQHGWTIDMGCLWCPWPLQTRKMHQHRNVSVLEWLFSLCLSLFKNQRLAQYERVTEIHNPNTAVMYHTQHLIASAIKGCGFYLCFIARWFPAAVVHQMWYVVARLFCSEAVNSSAFFYHFLVRSVLHFGFEGVHLFTHALSHTHMHMWLSVSTLLCAPKHTVLL